jgi:hypothetical protein
MPAAKAKWSEAKRGMGESLVRCEGPKGRRVVPWRVKDSEVHPVRVSTIEEWEARRRAEQEAAR